MSRERLRSNVQVRSAGIDASLGLIVLGLAVSAIVLLTILGATADSRRPKPRIVDNWSATAELAN